jgi:hypothetical protein
MPATRGVWVALVLAMMKRRHTGFGVREDIELVAEIVVGPVADIERGLAVLVLRGLIVIDPDGYLRAPLLRRLGLT